ncbi:hypothetical protein [Halorarum salinum]|uniref:Uncharacterized protein n=1 Tax=Halorarum salinum TaxID=2743089 RepID=A0A7D5LEP0_9EURY|nr:hypothetical protein [Halobaculum salinum]QLG64175.1 hypothetical protein HUG12_20505 [Halobaculum salinum]
MAESRSLTDWIAWLSPGVLVLVGLALFFLPVPPTSMIGIALIVVGVALWVLDYVGVRGAGGGGDET